MTRTEEYNQDYKEFPAVNIFKQAARDYDCREQAVRDNPLNKMFLKSADSEEKKEFRKHETGAVRSTDADEYRYDLISPIGLRAVARTCAEGASTYGDFNWERGFPAHDLLNHATKHIYDFLEGKREEDDLGHAAWNLLAAIHSLELWPELNRGKLRGPGCKPPIE